MDFLYPVTLFFILLLSASLGWVGQRKLHERHISRDSVESVRLLIGMLLTFTAIVLGLLTSTAKQRFDGLNADLSALGTDLIELDHRPYMARSAGGWRMLPREFGPWQTVYWWFRRFVRRLLFRTIHDVALMLDREQAGREASPSGGVLDSQTVKAPFAEKRGFDGGKKIVGRKRHVAVDTDGRLLMVNLTTADVSDSAGAQLILDTIRKRWPWLKHLFADGAYDRTRLLDKAAFLDFVIQVVRRSDPQPGFTVIPRRWVVERTFGWMIRWRRLVRDYEKRLDVSEAMIHVAMGSLLLRRIAHR